LISLEIGHCWPLVLPLQSSGIVTEPARARKAADVVSTIQAGPQRGARELASPSPSFGRYRLRRQLGAGASGVVFDAFDVQLRRGVALKLLSPSCEVHALREARAMASISHPNVLPIYDAGATSEAAYLAMELIEGSTLREWAKTPRTTEEVVWTLIQAGRGLAAAHAAGVLHRDFKPANVLIDRKGAVKVADFGLAAHAARRGFDATDSVTGARMGTEPYMSPEEEQGRPIDARSDQFSFCATVYELLAGERLFRRGTAAGAPAGFVAERLRRLGRKGVGRRVRRVLARGLAFEPDRRYPTMDLLLADLERALSPRLRPFLLAVASVAMGTVVALAN
jgi:serine/threonine protein kinase